MGYSETLAIVVLCYLLGEAIKAFTKLEHEKIPVIVGAAGLILGVVAMYVMPDFGADNILDAMASGVVSGLASTGFHQVLKNTIWKESV